MPGLDDAQRRAEEIPQGGSWDLFPTIQLYDGDTAYIRFVGDGGAEDIYTDSAYFHRVSLISKKSGKPYNREMYCQRTLNKELPCEYCDSQHGPDAQKVTLRIGLWSWVSGIHRANQNPDALKDPNKGYDVREIGNPPQKIFWENIEGPMVFKRGPGRGQAFMNQLKLIRELQGGLNTIAFALKRVGATMENTDYQLNPRHETKGQDWTDEQKVVLQQLPGIQELFSGSETWPRSAQAAGNQMIDPSQLTTLAPTAPAASEINPEAVAAAPVSTPVAAEVPETKRGGVF